MGKRLPKLPELLQEKIYKTGQTRGADDDVIYQNRVLRNNTVLIPYESWSTPFSVPEGETEFENGFIVLVSPRHYFETPMIDAKLQQRGLELGMNALVFYYSRDEWDSYNPAEFQWTPAENRTTPLGGNYVARVPATTALEGGNQIRKGFTTSSSKGAGIRVFEYAAKKTISKCRDQLEALFWLCWDSDLAAIKNGMTRVDVLTRKEDLFNRCTELDLLDYRKLIRARVLNTKQQTVCPLCLERISGMDFFSRMQQAKGREVQDITVTKINLFHIEELRVGEYNHRPYNLGWGHHHCNVVTKDSGIADTLKWMEIVLDRNTNKQDYLESLNSVS